MILNQYSSLFSLLILTSLLIPAMILGIYGKSIKWYGMFVSIPILFLIIGWHSKQIPQFILFIIYETVLLFGYYYLNKKSKNKFIYYSIFALSMIPIILVKVCVHFDNLSVLGFVGISYISFRVWQLIIEIHDNHIEKLSLPVMIYFITFFPTLSSGPIDRYNRFKQDVNKKLSRSEYINDYMLFGFKKICMGIIYKFAIAASINIFIIDKIPKEITFSSTIIYMYMYTFYLFFDFAGYSNFAIGTSYLLGIKSPENFNKPFLSHNMKEFWDRWHMSLSKWFGDYIFSRFVLNTLRNGTFKNKKIAVRFGYMLTMILMGLWHGFYLFYLFYGIYQGLMLVFTDIYTRSKIYKKFKKSKHYNIISRIICFQFIAFGMLLFSGYLFSY